MPLSFAWEGLTCTCHPQHGRARRPARSVILILAFGGKDGVASWAVGTLVYWSIGSLVY